METQTFAATTERLVRAAVFMILVDAFALLFLWDGYVGYQQENAVQLAELLGLPKTSALRVNPRVNQAAASRLIQTESKNDRLRLIQEALGKPSLEHEGVSYYLGPGGWLAYRKNGPKRLIEWTDAERTEMDLIWQRYIGYALVVVSLFATFLFLKTTASRITISETGIRIFGRDPVSWDALTGLARKRNGTIRVDVAGGEAIEINPYVYRDVDQIVAMICKRKGFANPLNAS